MDVKFICMILVLVKKQEGLKPIPSVFVFIKSTGDLFHKRVYFKFRKALPSNTFRLN